MNWQPAGDPEEVEDPNLQLAEEDTSFVGPDIETDQTVVLEQSRDGLREKAPGWEPHDGNLEDWLMEEWASLAAELRALIVEVPDPIFVTYGEEVLGIPIRAPVPATGYSTWVATDDAGYSIEAGERIVLPGLVSPGDELVEFELVEGAVIEPGQTRVENVQIRASEAGVRGSGLSGHAEPLEPPDWLEYVDVPAPTRGGDDGQDQDSYLNGPGGLSQLLRMIALRPVLPLDYAILALRIPGVARAVAMDGYDPASGTWGHERTIALLLAGDDGKPCEDEVKREVRTMLEQLREVNVRIYVIDAVYDKVDVAFTVTAFAEQDPDVVGAIAEAAVEQYLNPARYRLGTTSPSIAAGEVIPPPAEGQEPGQMTIRVNELIALLDRSRGVDWVDQVLIDGQAVDRVLTGPTTLPEPGDIQGTVNTQ